MRVRLLGDFRVLVGPRDLPKDAFSLKKAASLIKLLALSPSHTLHREQVMDVLWPTLTKGAASNNLRQTLHAARLALHPEPGIASRVLESSEERIALCPQEKLWVDSEAFEDAARGARRAKEISAYEAALDLYGGELLPEERYEEWAEGPRAHLRGIYLSLLSELASLYEQRADYGSAERTLGKLLAEEPTNEGAHLSLMRLYALSGRRGEALAQYGRLKDTLSRRLGMEPSASVHALREEISSGRYPPPDAPRDQRLEEGAPCHNIPLPRSSFVDREEEIVEVKRELAMTRLLTLTGAGGTGKTRLALEVARDLAGAYLDGAWLVELAPLSRGGFVAQEVASTLGVQELPITGQTSTC